jgi:hypothetical protein
MQRIGAMMTRARTERFYQASAARKEVIKA